MNYINLFKESDKEKIYQENNLRRTKIQYESLRSSIHNKNFDISDVRYDEILTMLSNGNLSDASNEIIKYFAESSPGNDHRINLSEKQTHKLAWEIGAPKCYNANEAMVIGLNMIFHNKQSSLRQINRAMEFIEYAKKSSKKFSIHLSTSFISGCILFDKAINENDPLKKNRSLKLSISKFKNCLKLGFNNAVLLTKIGIIYTLQNKMGIAVKFIRKACKITSKPDILYFLLSKIYASLELDKAALFYRRKISANFLEGNFHMISNVCSSVDQGLQLIIR